MPATRTSRSPTSLAGPQTRARHADARHRVRLRSQLRHGRRRGAPPGRPAPARRRPVAPGARRGAGERARDRRRGVCVDRRGAAAGGDDRRIANRTGCARCSSAIPASAPRSSIRLPIVPVRAIAAMARPRTACSSSIGGRRRSARPSGAALRAAARNAVAHCHGIGRHAGLPPVEESRPRWEVPGTHPVVRGVDPLTLSIQKARAYSSAALIPVARSARGTPLVYVRESSASPSEARGSWS